MYIENENHSLNDFDRVISTMQELSLKYNFKTGADIMSQEEELMNYLHEKVFDPILNSKIAPQKIKSGVNLTIARMSRLKAEKMVQYFWSALATENAISFSKHMKKAGLTRFEDVMEEFRDKFDEKWLRKNRKTI